MNPRFSLILGTALWGWSVPRPVCLELLDQFYGAGLREVDTATNYPINKDAACFRLAETVIADWIRAHGVTDLEVIVKIGSVDNSGSPLNNLSYSYCLLNLDYYRGKFGLNLSNLTVHWDNRENEDDLRSTLAALEVITSARVAVGLSGIKRPDIYHRLSRDLPLHFTIQCKHNLLHSGLPRYKLFRGAHRFLAYGLNLGGLNLAGRYRETSSATLRHIDRAPLEPLLAECRRLLDSTPAGPAKPPTSLNQLGLLYAYNSPGLSGAVIGPSTPVQLRDSLDFRRVLDETDTSELYHRLDALRTRDAEGCD